MTTGDPITVVHKGAVVRAHAYTLKPGRGWWWVGVGLTASALSDQTLPSGQLLGDEGIHYVRGHKYRWWPPHRKQRDALLTASALAGPPPVPTPMPPQPITPTSAQAMLNQMTATLTKDFDRIFDDATKNLDRIFDDAMENLNMDKLIEDAERLARKGSTVTVTVNGRRVR